MTAMAGIWMSRTRAGRNAHADRNDTMGDMETGMENEMLQSQVARLADYIIENVPGEPSQSQGAIDTAIRLLGGVYGGGGG